MSNLVLAHHKGCPDGISAAWAAWLKYPHATFMPCDHKVSPELSELEGRDVIMVDFCYSREETEEIKRVANSFLVLDHHKTAQEKCGDLDYCHFDMTKSGAGLAWEYFHPDQEVPWLVEYIQFRDLGYLWTRPVSEHPENLEEILETVDSHERTFEKCSEFAKIKKGSDEWNMMVQEGKAILRAKKQLIERIARNAQEVTIRGKKALCVNSPIFQSEVGNLLTRQDDAELGMVWYQGREAVTISLRSVAGKADISTIAKSYPRGGGHRNAAGFSLDKCNIQELLDLK